MANRPRIGVSACLLGERVRYDGGDKRNAWLVDELGPAVEWVSVCPEVEAGMATPRAPMELVRGSNGGVVLMTDQLRPDLTDALRVFSRRRVAELTALRLDGYVLKAGSPSCAIAFGAIGPGLFAAELMRRMPDLPVIDDQALADPAQRRAFVDAVYARHRAGTAGG